MKYEQGLVSVIIPTYKRADKLLRAVNSVCNQTYRKIEVLVVNDNENDDDYTRALVELMSKITDTRVRLVFQEKHINGAAARNAGIRIAQGEFIAFLDDDDYWDATKIEKQIKTFATLDESYGAVSTMFKSFLDDKIIAKSIPYQDGLIWENILLRRCDVTTCSVLVRHTALDKTGYFDESLLRHQEIQLLSYLCHDYKLHLLKEYLLYVDAWGENNPSPEKLINIKESFFKSVQPLMDEMPKRKQRRIRIMHSFEIAYAYFISKNIGKCIKYSLPLFTCPLCIFYAIERVLVRIKSKEA